MDAFVPVLTALVGVGGTLGGVWLTRRHQSTAQLSAALAQFLAELDGVALVARRALRQPRWVWRANAWLERRSPVVDVLADELMRATIGRGLAEQERRFRVAANGVLLVAPPPLKATVVETLRLLQSVEPRDALWVRRWLEVRDRLQEQARSAVGAETSSMWRIG